MMGHKICFYENKIAYYPLIIPLTPYYLRSGDSVVGNTLYYRIQVSQALSGLSDETLNRSLVSV